MAGDKLLTSRQSEIYTYMDRDNVSMQPWLEHNQVSGGAGGGALLLMTYTLLLFLRPHELIEPLTQLHLPLVVMVLMFIVLLSKYSHEIKLSLGQKQPKIVLALVAIMFLTCFTGYWLGGSIIALKDRVVPVIVIYFIIICTCHNTAFIKKLVWLIVIGAFANDCFAVFDFFDGTHMVMGRLYGRSAGLYGGPNDLAITTCLIIPFALWLYRISTLKLHKIFLILFVFIASSAIYLTYSRTGILAAGVMILGLIYFSKHRVRLLILWLFIMGVFFVFASERFHDRVVSIVNPDKDEAGARGARLDLAAKGVQIFYQHPLTGLGLGNFTIAEGQTHDTGHWKVVHNGYLEVATETGIGGFLLFIGLLVSTFTNFVTANRVFRSHDAWREWSLLCNYMLIIFAMLLLSLFFGSSPYGWILFYVTAFSYICKRESDNVSERTLAV